ncbi:MAG TPA: hypothetical protein VMT63_06985 [Bacteroidales bacterium]|nr:hypothetical protein [Bacteroidales bacterium]
MSFYQEDQEYDFIVGRKITAPDNSEHIILTGPDERKFLIPAANYLSYGLSAGQAKKCRVDRINCRGEIFLEPENPWYHEGQYYFFRVARRETRTNFSGKNINAVIVSDRGGNENAVEISGKIPLPGSRVRLLVEKISKGRLFLLRERKIRKGMLMKIGKEYEFTAEGITIALDGRKYFIVSDPCKRKHLLPYDYYESYGIKPGSIFRGRIVKFRLNREVVIEPENPFFKIGSRVSMTVGESTRSSNGNSFNINLIDEFGHSHCLEMPEVPHSKTVECMVRMIRKGKPQFEVL